MALRNPPKPRPKDAPKEKVNVERVAAFVKQAMQAHHEQLARANNQQRRGRRLQPSPSLKAVK